MKIYSVKILNYVKNVGNYYGMIIQSVTVLHYVNTVGNCPTL
jgi:hypothetical protein